MFGEDPAAAAAHYATTPLIEQVAEVERLREIVARVEILVRDLEHSGIPLTAQQLRRALDGEP
jgi:hypothetical protein